MSAGSQREVHLPDTSDFIIDHSENKNQVRRCMNAILAFEIITKTLKISTFFLDLIPPKCTDQFH